ncbi:MAG: type IV pilus modification protein PilV [Wenzhouxiangella sp.]|nr:type IV pilus modification protein PilV [Wenzhouxiangella sp.]
MNRLSRSPRTHQASSGVTLIEVLIAVLVLSIGLLGLAALQGVALQSGQAAYYRSQATAIAYEAADFMRANYSTLPAIQNQPAWEQWQSAIEATTNARAILPGPDDLPRITITPSGSSSLLIRVSWLESRLEETTGSVESVTLETFI